MNTIIGQPEAENHSAVALAATGEEADLQRQVNRDESQSSTVLSEEKRSLPLFLPDVAKTLRARWDVVQSSFVDDPRQAVRQGDELVGQVMQSLAEAFSNEHAKLEGELDRADQPSTENLRIALRRYRSFSEHLLTL
jgi:flagellar biosynthesis/type III secretory pathway ATPase